MSQPITEPEKETLSELDKLRQEVQRIQQETAQKFQNTLSEMQGIQRTFDITNSILRDQRDTANDQVVQEKVRVVQLQEVEAALRSHIQHITAYAQEQQSRGDRLEEIVAKLTEEKDRLEIEVLSLRKPGTKK